MIIPAGYAQANFIYSGASAPNGAQWTLGLDVDPGETPESVSSDLEIAYNAGGLSNVLNSTWTLSGILVKFGPNATGPSHLRGLNIPGLVSEACCPPNVTALIRKHTAMGGRAGRGRIYWPGIGESRVDGAGNLLASYITALTTEFNDFLELLSVGGHPAVLLHGAGSPISEPLLLLEATVDSKAATQRRRLRR